MTTRTRVVTVGNQFALDRRLRHETAFDPAAGVQAFLGHELHTHNRVVVFVQNLSDGKDVEHAARVLQALANSPAFVPGVPHVLYAALHGLDQFALVVAALGPTLRELLQLCGGTLSEKSVCMLALQLLHLLEHAHKRRVVLNGLAPEALRMGASRADAHHVALASVALATALPAAGDAAATATMDADAPPPCRGNLLFGSNRYCLGLATAPRDDLESLGYLLHFLRVGALPWEPLVSTALAAERRGGSNRWRAVAVSKEQLRTGADAAPPVRATLEVAQRLAVGEAPPYDALRRGFVTHLRAAGDDVDYIFDWLSRPQHRP